LKFRDEAHADAAALFAGAGEVRSHARDLDWSKSPLGPTTGWSPAVRTLARSIYDSPFPICLWSGSQYALVYNDAYRRILAAKHPASLGQPGSIVWAEIWEELQPQFDGVRQQGETVYFEDAPFVMARLEGGGTETAWFNYSLSPLRDEDGSVAAVLNITPETTSRVLVERRLAKEQAALANSEAHARLNVERVQLALAAGAIIGTWHWDLLTDRFTVDEAFARSFGLDPALGRDGIPLAQIVATVHPDDQAGLAVAIDAAIARGGPYAHQYRTRRADGHYYWLEANGRVDKGSDGTSLTFPGVLIDVEKRRADEAERMRVTEELRRLNETLEQRVADRTAELMRMEDALRQAQKMEAVGQLTGGLAHDFNNLLAGISGSLELMQARMQQGRLNDVERYMAAAQGAAKRAAALTHRLLAFSRRQTLDPKPTNVNRLVNGMQEMIQRTVGPGIAVETVGVGSIWPVLVDPSQLENSLLNLCLNSRDAMSNGGRITIETANRWLDERTAKEHDVPEGQYLSLCVTDTGTGMSPEVIARVFEPFYTTKPIGEGTGLGLSMIYGFAKQSGGQVRIYSEVGKGTTVCIYLPRHYGEVEDEGPTTERPALPRSEQGETVLVVDDEPTVRMLITDILDELGFTAIEASDSAAGLKVLQSDVRIDLLVTDVGLPGGMNGRQMADAGRVHRPHLKVLFITGYAENAAVGNGQLAPGMAVLTKPFPVETMAARIRSMIEAAKEQQRPALRKY
jgi:signal transduction histidine kinase/PAS domain-containing protein/ActR/RegA family two-component response regulator